MKCRVEVSLKPGVLDAEGNAAADGLRALGFKVDKVSFTKEYVIEGKFSMADAEEMCRKLLANPIIQNYKVEQLEGGNEDAEERPKPAAAKAARKPKAKPKAKPKKKRK